MRGQCAGDDHEEDAGRDEVVERVDGCSAGGGTRNLAKIENWKLEVYFFSPKYIYFKAILRLDHFNPIVTFDDIAIFLCNIGSGL